MRTFVRTWRTLPPVLISESRCVSSCIRLSARLQVPRYQSQNTNKPELRIHALLTEDVSEANLALV